MIRIDIVSDTVCPWCFIGKRRLEAALQQRGPGAEPVTIVWRPYQLNPDMPEGGLDRREYLETKFGGPERARVIYDRVRGVEALFRAYFLEGRDIGAIDTLVACAAALGLPAEEIQAYLESDEDADLIRGLDAQARSMGIDGVPCFIFNNQYALSGAQEPALFLKVFAMLDEQEAGAADAAPVPAE
jgi:predicted DsbA family dithiol-disulfide isomerase